MKPSKLLHVMREMLVLPRVVIRISGNGECKRIYQIFTSRHPRYKLFHYKEWGVALIELPNSFEEFLRGNEKGRMRTNRSNATRHGFKFEKIDPEQHMNEIYAISRSMPNRQGRPIEKDYVDERALRLFFQEIKELYAIMDSNGVVKAYAHGLYTGEVFVLIRFMGHGEDLPKGIMYLLMGEIIREAIQSKACCGNPRWLMYDTMLGASSGLKYFKERIGFKPFRVKWIWDENAL